MVQLLTFVLWSNLEWWSLIIGLVHFSLCLFPLSPHVTDYCLVGFNNNDLNHIVSYVSTHCTCIEFNITWIKSLVCLIKNCMIMKPRWVGKSGIQIGTHFSCKTMIGPKHVTTTAYFLQVLWKCWLYLKLKFDTVVLTFDMPPPLRISFMSSWLSLVATSRGVLWWRESFTNKTHTKNILKWFILSHLNEWLKQMIRHWQFIQWVSFIQQTLPKYAGLFLSLIIIILSTSQQMLSQ